MSKVEDEVYGKPQLIFHGGKLFGKAVNDPKIYPKTVFRYIICS